MSRRRRLRRGVVWVGVALVALAPAIAWAESAGGDRSPDEVRAVAHEVLGRDEFHPDTSTNLISDALQWLADHLVPDFVRGGFGSGPGFLGPLVYVAIIGAIAYAIWLLLRGWTRMPKPTPTEVETVVELEPHRTATEWAQLAADLERDGRLREALRARYGELVTALVDDGTLSGLPGRTSGEFRAEVAITRPAGLTAFGAATDVFEADWYGGADTSAADLEGFRALAAEVRAAPRAKVDLGVEVGAS